MQTIWDWLTIGLFAGLVILLLQRSAEPRPTDRLWQYAPPAVACMAANQFGNNGYALPAVLLLVAGLAYVWYVLKPLDRSGD